MRRRKIEGWVRAGLIDEAQGERILAHEAEASRPLLLYAVASLASLAIGVGLISVVAAHWTTLPGFLKIGIDLGLVAGLGFGLVRLDAKGSTWVYDVVLGIFYGLVLASIALVGQVYQLGGHTHEALWTWSLMTGLAMWTGRGRFVLTAWVVGLQVSILVLIGHEASSGSHEVMVLSAGSLVVFLVTHALGNTSFLRRTRPELGGILRGLAWAEILAAGSLATLWFYPGGEGKWGAVSGLAAALAALAATAAVTLVRGPGQLPKRVLLGSCAGLALLAPVLAPAEWGLVGALLFLGLWLIAAWAAHAGGRSIYLNIATAVLAGRLLIIYLEVFESLLGTGLGLIGGGLLTLGLVWLWLRVRRAFRAEELPS